MAFLNEVNNKEELFDLLVNYYDVEEKSAKQIIENLSMRHRLSESEEILLLSYGVESNIIESVQRNKNLIYQKESPMVGPFFYIDGKLYCHKYSILEFNNEDRFFNDPISHFDYFNMLGIDGDYGNYPRGRVIYDNYHKRYIVYLDKSILKDEIKTQIKKSYSLEDEIVVFRRDAHYTHDWL